MNPFTSDALLRYWSVPEIGVSVIILMNLVGALILGSVVGYERSYRSRAACMRTLGLVCMGSAALTVVCGYPHLWYGGHVAASGFDGTTRVIQGIVTGIGFLGAGVIVKEGAQISGLTTAASIWVVAAIGILVGVGFYLAAIVLAMLSAAFTMWGSKFEVLLPSQSAVLVKIRLEPHAPTTEDDLKRFFKTYGYISSPAIPSQSSARITVSTGRSSPSASTSGAAPAFRPWRAIWRPWPALRNIRCPMRGTESHA